MCFWMVLSLQTEQSNPLLLLFILSSIVVVLVVIRRYHLPTFNRGFRDSGGNYPQPSGDLSSGVPNGAHAT